MPESVQLIVMHLKIRMFYPQLGLTYARSAGWGWLACGGNLTRLAVSSIVIVRGGAAW